MQLTTCMPVFFLISVGNFYLLLHLCVVNLNWVCWTILSANVNFGFGIVCSGWRPLSDVNILYSPSFCWWQIGCIWARDVALIVCSFSFVLLEELFWRVNVWVPLESELLSTNSHLKPKSSHFLCSKLEHCIQGLNLFWFCMKDSLLCSMAGSCIDLPEVPSIVSSSGVCFHPWSSHCNALT